MGHTERLRIKRTQHFVDQLEELKLTSGCLQACLLAMGAKNIHLLDILKQNERQVGISHMDAYLKGQGFEIGASYVLDSPVNYHQIKDILNNPGVANARANYEINSGKRIAGLLFALGKNRENAPHIIGVLPRGDMTRNLRSVLKKTDSHLIIDTSLAGEPIYTMKTSDITSNLNELITNKITVSLHIVTRV